MLHIAQLHKQVYHISAEKFKTHMQISLKTVMFKNITKIRKSL